MARRTVGGKGFLLLFKGQPNWRGIEKNSYDMDLGKQA